MPDPNVTSAEQLDDLLRTGRISREEYETLRKAMDTATAEESEHWRHEARPRLGKSWKNRQLGGVCAGIAERLAIEPWRVRLIFLLLLPFPFTRWLVLFVYLVLLIILPWKDKGASASRGEWRFPWKFTVRAGVLWLTTVFICVVFESRALPILMDLNRPLPALSRRAIELGDSVTSSLVGFLNPWLTLGLLVGFYLILPPDKPVKRIYAAIVYAALLLQLILTVVGCCLPIFMLADTVR